jgi:hypothetical protein
MARAETLQLTIAARLLQLDKLELGMKALNEACKLVEGVRREDEFLAREREYARSSAVSGAGITAGVGAAGAGVRRLPLAPGGAGAPGAAVVFGKWLRPLPCSACGAGPVAMDRQRRSQGIQRPGATPGCSGKEHRQAAGWCHQKCRPGEPRARPVRCSDCKCRAANGVPLM